MTPVIGYGLQFVVYDEGTKVRKVPATPEQIRFTLVEFNDHYSFLQNKIERRVQRLIHDREKSIQRIRTLQIPPQLIGNPFFLWDGSVLQDKLVPLGQRLHDLVTVGQIEYAKIIIDKLADFVIECWKHGFSEASYNLMVNYGVDSYDTIVLMDFGELFFSKKTVATTLKEKWYLQNWSVRDDPQCVRCGLETCTHHLPLPLRQYATALFQRKWTEENLDRYWNQERLRKIKESFLLSSYLEGWVQETPLRWEIPSQDLSLPIVRA